VVKQIYRASKGIPRLVNILAHKSLMAAFGEGARTVTERHVRMAVADTESTQGAWTVRAKLLKYLTALVPLAIIGCFALVNFALPGGALIAGGSV
jgi:MSHA biogenesis protein MshM